MSPVPACLCLSCVWVGLGLEMPPNTSLLVCKKRASRPRIGHLNMIELQIVAPSLQSLRQLEAAEAQSRHHTATPTPHSGQAGCRHPDLKGYYFTPPHALPCHCHAKVRRRIQGNPRVIFLGGSVLPQLHPLLALKVGYPPHPVQVGGRGNRAASSSGWETSSSARTCRPAIA